MNRRKFIKTASLSLFSILPAYCKFYTNDMFYFDTSKFHSPYKILTQNYDDDESDAIEDETSIFNKDLQLNLNEMKYVVSIAYKLKQIKKHIGFGHFNIISFDKAIMIAKNVSKIKNFTKNELNFIEYIYNDDPEPHGFFGPRTSDKLTNIINPKTVKKIPYTGHYLFKDVSEQKYKRLTKDVGKNLILTSGVRSIVKQMSLFLNKIIKCNGNISKASRSIAPPAYSFHTVGDFDVGRKGFGFENFTVKFAKTKEFKIIQKLKYIDTRYTLNNKDGVRYEPWHIKVI